MFIKNPIFRYNAQNYRVIVLAECLGSRIILQLLLIVTATNKLVTARDTYQNLKNLMKNQTLFVLTGYFVGKYSIKIEM